MKKLFLLVTAFFMMNAMNAQTGLGVNGGLLIGMAKIDIEGIGDNSNSETGFYAGVFKQFPLSEGFEIQPAINAAVIDGEFALQIPIMAKYYVAQGFNVQAGPQFLFDFEDVGDDYSSFNFGLALGVGYDFTEKFLAEARYGFQLNNYYTGDLDGISLKTNTLNIGVGYKF